MGNWVLYKFWTRGPHLLLMPNTLNIGIPPYNLSKKLQVTQRMHCRAQECPVFAANQECTGSDHAQPWTTSSPAFPQKENEEWGSNCLQLFFLGGLILQRRTNLIVNQHTRILKESHPGITSSELGAASLSAAIQRLLWWCPCTAHKNTTKKEHTLIPDSAKFIQYLCLQPFSSDEVNGGHWNQ